ncbi:MAG: F0F1 ATP synthase subunit B [Saprospiraceae bacterium]|nr:F0F1 ATP synthase subunit B [Saprospiraceae bacterium]
MLFVLADFSVIKPDFGLLFWTTVIFLLFWFIIGKFAFRPIANALKKREDDIQTALDEASKAREEMNEMKAENEALLAEAREERAEMLKEAKDTKNAIIKEAKDKAKEEAKKIVDAAQQEIENQRKAVLNEVKNQVGRMAVDISERILEKELADKKAHDQLIKTMVDDIKLN